MDSYVFLLLLLFPALLLSYDAFLLFIVFSEFFDFCDFSLFLLLLLASLALDSALLGARGCDAGSAFDLVSLFIADFDLSSATPRSLWLLGPFYLLALLFGVCL